MSSGSAKLQSDYGSKEAFLASLSRYISVPTTDWPTVRCWTKTSLDRMFRKIKDDLGAEKPPQSNVELLNWLQKLALAWAIEADGALFYLLEMGPVPNPRSRLKNLMMAYEPKGVVCFFSALAFHSLTSQVPGHHHMAVLTDSPPAAAARPAHSVRNRREHDEKREPGHG